MRPRHLRVRTLFVVTAVGSAALATVAATAVAVRLIHEELAAGKAVSQASAVVEALSSSMLLAGAGAAAVAALLGLGLATLLMAPLRQLRVALFRGMRRPSSKPSFELSGITDVDALVRAVELFATELGARAERLGRERNEMALLLSAVGEGIMQLDPGGRIVRINPAARLLLGLPAEAEGQPIASFVRHGQLRRVLERAAGGKNVPTCEVTIDDRRLLVAARPLVRIAAAHEEEVGGASVGSAEAADANRNSVAGATDARDGRATDAVNGSTTDTNVSSGVDDAGLSGYGRVIGGSMASGGTGSEPAAEAGAVVAFADLTELRRLEGVRRDFVANASHELKTPLTSIRGYAETLLDDSLPAELQREFLTAVRNNAERLQLIVDDLLDLSRLESGAWRPDPADLDVSDLAHEVWGSFQERADSQHVAFAVLMETDLGGRADAGALRQVFSNLFDNALRHTPAGGGISVRVAADACHTGRLSIEVQDDGAGIPGDALPRIFERFYRVDPARSRAEGGTGLGLSIVRHLVETMGGDVAASSTLGKGTTIRVCLPAAVLPVTSNDAA